MRQVAKITASCKKNNTERSKVVAANHRHPDAAAVVAIPKAWPIRIKDLLWLVSNSGGLGAPFLRLVCVCPPDRRPAGSVADGAQGRTRRRRVVSGVFTNAQHVEADRGGVKFAGSTTQSFDTLN